MCGVFAQVGVMNYGWSMDRLTHRGIRRRIEPTARNLIGHVRLPIVGTDEKHDQPVHRGPWLIAFVGEILDFRERHPEMECDIDLVADTWEKSGSAGFRDFDGFWSVVAADERTGAIHGLTDYLAQKPLYYRSDSHGIAIASEPEAVACLGPTTPNELYLAACIKWGYDPSGRHTPYNEVKRMRPGEHLILHPSGSVGLKTVDQLKPLRAGVLALKGEIEAAVKRRVLSSDVPVACLVSGGLDSAITYMLAKRYGAPRAYHVENDELDAAKRVLGNDPVTVLDYKQVSYAKALHYFQEPVDLGSLRQQCAVSDAIGSSGAERVCLTGDGADEFFGGYGRAERYDSQASDVWHELVCWHLPRLDRTMMRNRIEVRSPFLARRVAQIALGLDYSLRVDKNVLRALFRGDLPLGVADVPKKALRSAEVQANREKISKMLVDQFREKTWPVAHSA